MSISLRHAEQALASNWGAKSTRPHDIGAAYAEMMFRGFEAGITGAAANGCTEGIATVRHPIRFRLDDTYTVGQKIDVAIANVGTRPYLFEFYYQACFLSYFDSSGRRFIIPPGTHCDIRGKKIIRPGETKGWVGSTPAPLRTRETAGISAVSSIDSAIGPLGFRRHVS